MLVGHHDSHSVGRRDSRRDSHRVSHMLFIIVASVIVSVIVSAVSWSSSSCPSSWQLSGRSSFRKSSWSSLLCRSSHRSSLWSVVHVGHRVGCRDGRRFHRCIDRISRTLVVDCRVRHHVGHQVDSNVGGCSSGPVGRVFIGCNDCHRIGRYDSHCFRRPVDCHQSYLGRRRRVRRPVGRHGQLWMIVSVIMFVIVVLSVVVSVIVSVVCWSSLSCRSSWATVGRRSVVVLVVCWSSLSCQSSSRSSWTTAGRCVVVGWSSLSC